MITDAFSILILAALVGFIIYEVATIMFPPRERRKRANKFKKGGYREKQLSSTKNNDSYDTVICVYYLITYKHRQY